MSEILPRLRGGLDVLPSPVPGRPGLVLRDPFRYTVETLLIPPPWVPALSCLDGEHTELDMQSLLVRQSGGQLVFSHDIREFVSMLRSRGFLETEEFLALREAKHAEFRASRWRLPTHAGVAYPDDASSLKATFDAYFAEPAARLDEAPDQLLALAAPHVSPQGGRRSYAAAYQNVDASLAGRTFVILGTSHYGEPDKFGLTVKPFTTPLGVADVDTEGVDFLARRAPDAVTLEDYCHAIEHSIEFQIVFLQYRVGVVRILPVLCGPFVEFASGDETPESSGILQPFFDALTELERARAGDLFWILGIDLAHMGSRYGDPFIALPGQGAMAAVEAEDRLRLAKACEGDLPGLYQRARSGEDPLKWCGLPPLYTFLASVPKAVPLTGRVLSYEQWSIDPQSVVSFAGLGFVKAQPP